MLLCGHNCSWPRLCTAEWFGLWPQWPLPCPRLGGPAYSTTHLQLILLSVMAALKNCQILNLIWRWTSPLSALRGGVEQWELLGKVLSSSGSTESLWVAKALMYKGAEGSRVNTLDSARTKKGPKTENESERKQDHNFGRPKNCKKEDIETCTEVTKTWHVGTQQIPLVSPFYSTSLFPNYKKSTWSSALFLLKSHLNPRFN